MSDSLKSKRQGGFLKSFGKAVNTTRLVIINIVFWTGLILGIVLILFAFKKERVPISGNSLLLIAPAGLVVEEYSVSELALEIDSMMGEPPREVLLNDIIKAVDLAASDSRISALFLDCRYFYISTLSGSQEFRWALQRFGKTGKTIIVYSDFYDQLNYLYSSTGDELYLNPMGAVSLPGFSVYQPYFGDGLERLQVEVNVFRSGEFKSFVEPFTLKGMSEPVREQNRQWLASLWHSYLAFVSESSGKSRDELENYTQSYGDFMDLSGGNPALAARTFGLITAEMDYGFVEDEMISRYGEEAKTGSFKSVSWDAYLEETAAVIPSMAKGKGKIAVLYGSGNIVYGEGYFGKIGSSTYSEMIRRIREDPDIKAVVFRLDSGGGSSFASEEIRRSLSGLRATGIPVVVSMGDMAASGAYWIATESDWITAYRTTLTGSIGVFSIVPTFENTLETFAGIRFDGIGTTPYSGGYTFGMPLNDEMKKVYQKEVEWIYRYFLVLVSEKRGIPPEQLQDLAGGRVWDGAKALELGLVDGLGGYQAALEKGASLAGLDLENCEIVVFRPDSRLKNDFPLLGWISLALGKGMDNNWFESVDKKLSETLTTRDPRGVDSFFPYRVKLR
jgi:protease-4